MFLEVGDLLEVGSEFDEGGIAEAVRVDDQLTVSEGVQVRLDQHQI